MNFEISSYIMNDWLSFFFVIIVLSVSVPISIYSLGYIKEYKNKYSTPYFWVIMILFILSMIGVLISNDGISFMVFWELMSVFSFFLVIYEYHKKENINNGVMYFIMTHISGLFLMLMFSLFYKFNGSVNFNEIITNSVLLTSIQRDSILILALLGFGAKAGLLPLHAWLPKAHPSAPSNISALMSGVMLKVALYGFIRITFMFVKDIPEYFSVILIISGVTTAIYSIYNALLQDDIKKLLAYSSSENIGIIFATLGLSLVLKSSCHYELSILAFTAALFHIVNHAVFKSILFASAGSVLYATGTKNMNELGGLYNKMKATTYFAFIGAAAISAIPPLNGFASEVLIFESFIRAGATIVNQPVVLVVFFSGVILATTSGCVVWATVKFFSMTFLGNARSEKAINTHSIPTSMNIGLGILSIYSILLGVFSPYVIRYISQFSSKIIKNTVLYNSFEISNEIIIVSGILLLISALIFLIIKLKTKSEKTIISDTWGCGFNNMKNYMQYSPIGFSQPATKVAGNLAIIRKKVRKKNKVYYEQEFNDLFELNLYSTVIKIVNYLSEKIVKIHCGKIQIYILYLFISVIFVLVFELKFV